jgi:hypothetical protein
MFHQANLRAYGGGKTLLTDLLDTTFAKYNALVNSTLPVQSPEMQDLGQKVADRTAYRAADAGVAVSTVAGTTSLRIRANRAVTVPITGLNYTGPAATTRVEEYGGQPTTYVTLSAGQEVVIPPPPPDLTITKVGTGSGAVTSSPAGIDCGADCTGPYVVGTSVTLTAAPAPGSSFVGWAGACSGTGACQITMDAAKSVTATFTRVNVAVTVSKPQLPPASGGPALTATLSARPGCGAIDHIDFGEAGRTFDNAVVSITSPGGGPNNRTAGFSYTPPQGTTSVTLSIQRVVQSGGATVRPMLFHDGCGAWSTFVGGGERAFQ